MKQCYRSGLFPAVLAVVFLLGSAAVAGEGETPAPTAADRQETVTRTPAADEQEQQVAETLRKTTHGRSMLSRDDGGDPESGRFMRALIACIRSFTGSAN